MSSNHSQAIPADVLREIEDMFKQIMAKLEPYHSPLSTADRREMTVIGDKTLGFLEKCREYAELYPALVPQWLNNSEFAIDFDDIHNLTPLRSLVDQVREAIYNIHYSAGAEAFQWMLIFYHSVKQAAARDVPNAKIVASELGKRFYRRRKRTGEEKELSV